MVKKLCADRGERRNIGISETRRTKNTQIIPPKPNKERTPKNVENRRRRRKEESLQNLGTKQKQP